MAAVLMVVKVVLWVVVIIPYMNSIAIVFVAPFDFRLELRPIRVLVSLNCVIWITASVPEIPCIRLRNTLIPQLNVLKGG